MTAGVVSQVGKVTTVNGADYDPVTPSEGAGAAEYKVGTGGNYL